MLFRLKQHIQRTFRKNHTADVDIWNLDSHLAEILAVKLKAFQSLELHGYPSAFVSPEEWPEKDNIPEDLVGGELAKWRETIDEMIYAFECAYMFQGDKNEEFLKKYNLQDPWRDTDYENFPMKKGMLHIDEINTIEERATKGREAFAKYFGSLWD